MHAHEIPFNANFFNSYVKRAPLALAMERYYECRILSRQKFQRPILDIGCGDGIFAAVMFSEKVDVGIDPNFTELERAKSEDKYHELIQCYGHQIPKPAESFRTIFSNSVFEHIPDIGAVIDECHRLLMKDGVLYLTIPTNNFEKYAFISQVLNAMGLSSWAKRFQVFYNDFWAHYHAYSIDEWTTLFEKHGFVVADYQLYDSKRSCLINDVLAYSALGSFFVRKFLRRWFLFPAVRSWISGFWESVWQPLLEKDHASAKEGEFGLVFFALKKNG